MANLLLRDSRWAGVAAAGNLRLRSGASLPQGDLSLRVERLAEEREESISRTSLRLIEEALEYQEDRHFSEVADARLKKKQRRVSHDEAWD